MERSLNDVILHFQEMKVKMSSDEEISSVDYAEQSAIIDWVLGELRKLGEDPQDSQDCPYCGAVASYAVNGGYYCIVCGAA